ncbi:hypothetical protein DCAR_0414628 [Daucus carota subsp. sativus]|uniref:Uncharacterized protein n=1 Tax=Daucus carota subsp. sativus TaxID=79200 RepID=A0A175YBY2_DAUCS|nr:hypothetical protein DCAR_0414628 [Daucus carota subsp. sativus]
MRSESTYSPGRRRSSRLIESRWVFNWPKKPAVFVNLGEDETGNSKHEVDGENKSGKKKEANAGKQTGTIAPVCPAEDTNATERVEDSKKAAMPGEVLGKNDKGKQCVTKRGKAEAQQPAEPHDKPKKTRTYKRYLQKKFTPAIITDTIANLSEAQSKWVRKAGFEHVLRHRNRIFPHRMAYNVVEAFDSEKCALVLQAGTVYITERLAAGSSGVGFDMTMRDLVVPDSMSGGDDVDAPTVFGTEKCGLRNEEEGSDGIGATLDGINDNIEYIIEELQESRNAEEMNEVLDTRNKVDVHNSPSHMGGGSRSSDVPNSYHAIEEAQPADMHRLDVMASAVKTISISGHYYLLMVLNKYTDTTKSHWCETMKTQAMLIRTWYSSTHMQKIKNRV